MKTTLTYRGTKESIYGLEGATNHIKQKFFDNLVVKADLIKWKARDNLEESIINEEESTGKLRESIKTAINGNVVMQDGIFRYKKGASGGMGGKFADKSSSIEITVGPDMREAPYAEYVEFGHYKRAGSKKYYEYSGGMKGSNWWEGYHYMENAWNDVSPDIYDDIVKNMKEELRWYDGTFGKITHRTTGEEIVVK